MKAALDVSELLCAKCYTKDAAPVSCRILKAKSKDVQPS